MLPATGSTMTHAISSCSPERARDRVEVVVGATSVSARRRRDARRVRAARASRRRSRLHEQRVGVAVVAALELDDPRAPREGARERAALIVASVPELTKRTRSTGRHRGQPRELDLERARRAEARAARGRPPRAPRRRAGARGRGSAAPRKDVVDVAVAVDVDEIRALAALDEEPASRRPR